MNCKRCHKDMMVDSPFCPWCGAAQEKKDITRTRGNGMGCVYKSGNSWIARVMVGWRMDPKTQKRKRVHRYSCGHKTKRAAETALAQLIVGAEKAKAVPSLNHYWEMYRDHEMQELSQSKQTAYTIAWKKLEALHFMKVDTITASDLRTISESVAPTFYPRKDIKSLLLHLFELAGADGHVSKDLPEYIQLPKLVEKEQTPFTPEEQAKMWRSYEDGNRDIRMPLIMIYTGMMPGELIRLKSNMIDWKEKVIRGLGMKTEVRKNAVIYIPDCLLPILEELCQESKKGKLFEINKDTLYNRYYDAILAAGCRKLPPYSCRHTTATALAITENIAPQTIRKIMRWSTTRMLDRYAHPTDSNAVEAVNKMKTPVVEL